VLFIISGPSGVGKTTICEALVKIDPNLVRLISHTTRKPRKRSDGTFEEHGVDYYFACFDKDYDYSNAEILEHSFNYGESYWTDKHDLESLMSSGADVLCNVDTNGALNLRRLYPDSLLIFIRPPSLEVLKERLCTRNSDDDIEARMAKAENEMMTGRLKYDYVVINDDLASTIGEIAYIIDTSRKRNVRVDLHTHTFFSDGTLSPKQLINAAKDAGVKILAITDHNYITKTDELKKCNRDITLIPGVEASCAFTAASGNTYEIHIVGLGVNADHPDLNGLLERNREEREMYITAILDKLRICGIDLGSYNDLAKKYPFTNQIGRMHIAEQMAERNFVNDTNEAFHRYIGGFGEKRAYVHNQQFFAPMSYMIPCILEAGGIPILAHPYYYQMPFDAFQDLIISVKNLSKNRGAIEVFYPSHTPEQTLKLIDIARDMGLMCSAGSDYHANGCDTLDTGFNAHMCRKLLEKLGIEI